MFVVYILKSKKTKRYYIGQTRNINQRLIMHNQGLTKTTKAGMPWEIIYTEIYNTRSEAILRETKIKSYKSGNAFYKLIGGVALTRTTQIEK